MNTFDLFDKDGRLYAFEVENLQLGRRGLVRAVRTISGATIIRAPLKLFSWFREEEFCEVAIGERRFVACEPFGDNSRYWIGTKPPGWCPELAAVRDALRAW